MTIIRIPFENWPKARKSTFAEHFPISYRVLVPNQVRPMATMERMRFWCANNFGPDAIGSLIADGCLELDTSKRWTNDADSLYFRHDADAVFAKLTFG